MFYLKGEHLLDINEEIYRESLEDNNIEYSGWDDYKININKIEALVANVPKTSLIEAATYYLKNIILLQAFPNANHRTAILAVEYFLKKNGRIFDYPMEELSEFHRESFHVQTEVYITLEAMSTKVLTDDKNEFYIYCLDFIERYLTEED